MTVAEAAVSAAVAGSFPVACLLTICICVTRVPVSDAHGKSRKNLLAVIAKVLEEAVPSTATAPSCSLRTLDVLR